MCVSTWGVNRTKMGSHHSHLRDLLVNVSVHVTCLSKKKIVYWPIYRSQIFFKPSKMDISLRNPVLIGIRRVGNIGITFISYYFADYFQNLSMSYNLYIFSVYYYTWQRKVGHFKNLKLFNISTLKRRNQSQIKARWPLVTNLFISQRNSILKYVSENIWGEK